MRPFKGLFGVLTMGIVLGAVSAAHADRVPSTRAEGTRDPGTRVDITVPFLTPPTNFNAYNVAPKIYATPQVDDPAHPAVRPTYNLPFYGGVMGFGDGNNGALPRPTAPKTSRASR
jgi:hypothetical protein